MIPLRTDSPLRHTPWMNYSLIAANIIMFIVQQMLWPGNPPHALQPHNPHLIDYFSYQFLHGSPLHLLGNMLFLYIFGNNVNDRMGNWGYLGFYLAGGVAAGIGHVLSSASPVIGASGAISAVTGAYLVLLPRSRITVLYWFILIGIIELPSVIFIALSFAMDFILGFGGSDSGVAHLAHLSGATFGILVSFVLLSVGLLPRDQFDLFSLVQRWNRRRQYRDMVSSGYDPFGISPPLVKSKPDPKFEKIQDVRAQISEAIAHRNIDDAVRFYLELHAIDPQQVLARQNQLDIANKLFADGIHGAAADAYEALIRQYPKQENLEQVRLMLGLLYARYLNRPDKARENLQAALERLSGSREIDLAKDELSRLGASA
jgi:membrane associated rhomboid family serine protease